MNIRERLEALSDAKNADFAARLAPGIGRERFLGVRLPALRAVDALVYGHTHIKVNEEGPRGIWLFNPGSVGIPKDGTHSYGLYEDGTFSHILLEG